MPEEERSFNENEPYQALYRRYRPQRFAGVLGQEHVTRALRNAVQEGKVAHAYLFSGPRGTGKTSTARILAMALNCEAPVAGEPDGTCASCLSIRTGSSMDVFELDAASNRKLDEMRDLLSRVALGSPGRWKVYIVDEVHQLTSDAASALLKTLEEPPRHVVFVLATTDPQKVLPTILSRTQHFEFRLLDGEVLTELLDGINQAAGLGLSPDAVRLAVRRGRGSARDAESALEQLSAAGGGEDDSSPLSELVDALSEHDTARTLQAVAGGIAAGKDARRLGNDLLEYMRNAFLAVQAPSLVLLPGVTVDKLAESARQMTLPSLVRAMEMIGQALVDMRDAVDPRVTLEVALIRLSSPSVDASPAALLERIERLERAVAERGERVAPPARPSGGPTAPPGGGSPALPGEGPPARPGAATPPRPDAAPAAGTGESRPGLPPPQAETPQGTAQPRVALGAVLRAGAGLRGGGVTPEAIPAADRPAADETATDQAATNQAATDQPAPDGATPDGATPDGATPDGDATAAPPPTGADETAQTGAGKDGTYDQKPPSPAAPAGSAGSLAAGSPAAGSPAAGLSAHLPVANAGSPAWPSRDELTKAWGDAVLERLSQSAKLFLSNGRFVEAGTGGGAVFAVPAGGFLETARDHQSEAEKALATYFGRPVPFHLVPDKGSALYRGSSAAATERTGRTERPGSTGSTGSIGSTARTESPDGYDLDDLVDASQAAPLPVVPVEERILQAFPGSVLDG